MSKKYTITWVDCDDCWKCHDETFYDPLMDYYICGNTPQEALQKFIDKVIE